MAEKNALGLSMSIDQKFVNDLAKDLVYESLITALGGKEEVIREIVRDFLSIKVDPDSGKRSTYSDAIPYMRYLTNAMISGEVKQAVQEVLDEKRPEIRAAIKKELSKKSTMDRMYDSFTKTMIENMSDKWRTKIDVTFDMERDD